MTDAETGIMRFFVMPEVRQKQVVALEYLERKYAEGFRDIVLAAPTGSGKTFLGATACFWSQALEAEGFSAGGFYLVTQKLLQDQLQGDFPKFKTPNAHLKCQSLKSASEYKCEMHGNCAFGLAKKNCPQMRHGHCSYMRQRNLWNNATLAVTNYPYLFTEHWATGKIPPRRVLVLDEVHGLERQILRFVEISITQEGLRKWVPAMTHVPDCRDVTDFADFLSDEYLPILLQKLETYGNWDQQDTAEDRKILQEKLDLENHIGKTQRAAMLISNDPENWLFYKETNRKQELEVYAKPLDASAFANDLIFNMGHVRIHMSAYPGLKSVFCRSLGLDPDAVAWLNLNSTFPVENRQVYLTMVGSMSRRNREESMPTLCKYIGKILDAYPAEKGIIHSVSYELGQQIYSAMVLAGRGERLLFPKTADERDPVFSLHKATDKPTVIITPSMGEGFNFADELARFQIIAKCPFPYLLDPQIEAKRNADPEWYDLETVKAIIQMTGRATRSETDVSHNYIMDADFIALYQRCEHFFPSWWREALVWPKRDKKA